VLRLRTFGGLWIEAAGGGATSPLTPRRLALLAVVAGAGRRGASRDRVLGLLWPERPEELGRHALSQTLYSLRRELGVEVVVGSNDLRLDPAQLTSDVGDFLAAMEDKDRPRQADLYTGGFLEGFYLPDTPEFERWADEERGRHRQSALEALETLARAETQAGHPREAAQWLLKLTALDPLSAGLAMRYMRTLADAGDRAGALAHARKHEELVRRELDTAPDPEVVELARRLKREKPAASVIPSDISAERPAAPALAGAASGTTTLPAAAPARRRIGWVLAGTGVGIAAVTAFLVSRPRAPESAPLLAVGQMKDAAARDSNTSTGVLTDMLATNLARVRGLQVVANSRLFELMRPGADTSRAGFSDAARRAGARQILEGEVSYAPAGGLQMDLRRIDLRSGVVQQGYRVRGLDRYALIDSATAAVARDFSFPAPGSTIAEVSTSSPLAYRLYEEGLRSYYQYDVAATFRLMESALREDSTFAIAAYYAWLSSTGMGEPNSKYLDLALRLAPKAPDRERLLILGSGRGAREDPDAIFPAESLAIRFPSDPKGQWLRGVVASMQGDYPLSVQSLNRAVELDSASGAGTQPCRACESLHALTTVYWTWDSAAAAERTARRWARFQTRSSMPLMEMAEAIARQGRWADVARVFQIVDSIDPGAHDFRELRMIQLIRRGEYDAFEREAMTVVRDQNQVLRTDAVWLWTIALRNQGRLREARALLRDHRLPDGSALSPPFQDPMTVAKGTVEFDSGSYDAAATFYHGLVEDNYRNPFPGHLARGVSWNLTLEATAREAAGDTAAVRRMADSVERIGRRSLFGRSPLLHHFIRGLLLADQGRHAEAVEAFRRAVISWSDGFTRINFELARSLMVLGKPQEAIAALQPALRGALDASNLYLTRTEIHELLAQAFVAAGQRDSAAAHYRAVVEAWEKADAQFQPRLQAARSWLAAH
jgi:DNA-binding SARP family transcriptional activator/TolB-like protein